MHRWLVAIFLTLRVATAAAENTCRVHAANADDAIPPTGVLALRAETASCLDLAWIGGEGETRVTWLSPTEARVEYQAETGAVLRAGDSFFALSRDAAADVPELRSLDRLHAFRDGPAAWYGELDHVIAQFPSPAAVHARWTSGGKTIDRWGLTTEKPRGHEVDFDTLPVAELDAGGDLALYALLFDGSEQLVGGYRINAMVVYPIDAAQLRRTDAYAPAKPHVRHSRSWSRAALVAAAILLVLLVVTAPRRRRRLPLARAWFR